MLGFLSRYSSVYARQSQITRNTHHICAPYVDMDVDVEQAITILQILHFHPLLFRRWGGGLSSINKFSTISCALAQLLQRKLMIVDSNTTFTTNRSGCCHFIISPTSNLRTVALNCSDTSTFGVAFHSSHAHFGMWRAIISI